MVHVYVWYSRFFFFKQKTAYDWRISDWSSDVCSSLTSHVNAIVALIARERLEHVVLVGHSLGGMVVSGVAEHTPEKLARLVYVDAFLPEHGESAFDQMAPAFFVTLKNKAAERGGGLANAGNDGKGHPHTTAP